MSSTFDDNSVGGKTSSNEVILDVLLPTIGSAGDVHPIIAFGTALQKRGHRATVITNQFFEPQVRDAGLDFVALGTTQEAEEAIAPNIDRLYQTIQGRRKPTTVVAASALCFGARVAQENLGVPLASVHLQ